jgi:hypothetical protein
VIVRKCRSAWSRSRKVPEVAKAFISGSGRQRRRDCLQR